MENMHQHILNIHIVIFDVAEITIPVISSIYCPIFAAGKLPNL